jgi:hypothetical protein
MNDTSQPDFATVLQFESMQNQIEELTKLLRDTEHALHQAREQNAKLRDIAERVLLNCETLHPNTIKLHRAELDQLKEITK